MKRGRLQLIRSKLVTAYLYCILIVTAIYGGNLLLTAHLYGLGDITRYVQSIEGFLGSTLNISVFEYLIMFLVVKLFILCLISSVLIIICILARNQIFVYLVTALAIFFQILLYQAIPGNSILSPLKYINIISFINVNSLTENYLNMNFLGYPINTVSSMLVTLGLLNPLLFIIAQPVFSGQKHQQFRNINLSVLLPIPFGANKAISTNLFLQEARKLLVNNKAALIVAAAILISIYQYNSYQVLMDDTHLYYKEYMSHITGPVTEETYRYMEKQEDYFTDLKKKLIELDQKYQTGDMDSQMYEMLLQELLKELKYESIHQKVKSRLSELENQNKAQPVDRKAWILYDTGFQMLLGGAENKEGQFADILFLVFLIACIAPAYGADNRIGMLRLLLSTKRGRMRALKYRYLVLTGLTLLLLIAANLPRLLNILEYYGTSGIQAPLQSLSGFEAFSLPLSIQEGLLLMYLFKLLFTFFITFLVLVISVRSVNIYTAFGISTVVLLLPYLLLYLGADFLKALLLNPLIDVKLNLLITKHITADQFVCWVNITAISVTGILFVIKALRIIKPGRVQKGVPQ